MNGTYLRFYMHEKGGAPASLAVVEWLLEHAQT
mgnify:CR=1 FL=1